MECIVCQERIHNKRECSECTALACKNCIQEWFDKKHTCPQCRGNKTWENVEYCLEPEVIIQRTGYTHSTRPIEFARPMHWDYSGEDRYTWWSATRSFSSQRERDRQERWWELIQAAEAAIESERPESEN